MTRSNNLPVAWISAKRLAGLGKPGQQLPVDLYTEDKSEHFECVPLYLASPPCALFSTRNPDGQPGARYLNRVDGKTYEFVSADADMVTFKREGRNTLRYLGRSEFDKRFEVIPPSPFHVVGRDVLRQALLDIRDLVRTDTTDGLDEAKDIAEAALNAPSETVLNPHTVGLSIVELQRAHVERQEEWCPDQKPDLSFRGNELGGECGEAQNVIKKLERERHGWRGSRDTVEHLAEELGDVIHCAILCAITAGIDLEPAVIAKFNNTSEKNGLATKLRAAIASVEGADND